MNDKYFALLSTEEIGIELEDKINDYYEYIESCGILKIWNKSHQQYYSGYYTQGEIQKRGQSNNLRKISVNHYNNILSHLLTITTKQRPTFDPKAINSDHKSLSQAILAGNICEYYMKAKGIEKYTVMAVDYHEKYGEGWVSLEWDFKAGDIVGQQEGQGKENIIRSGDIVCDVYTPDNVIRDINRKDIFSQDWLIVKKQINKFDLAAKYPQFAEEIIGCEMEKTKKNIEAIDDFRYTHNSDIINYYTFYHAKTASVPDGRMVEFVNSEIIVFDGKLQYKEIPIYSMISKQIDVLPFGYTIAFDLLPIQTAIDMLYSTIVTNQNAFGIQNVTAQKGSSIEVSDLGGGLKLLEYSGDKKPEPMNLLSTAPEIFKFLRDLIGDYEILSGMNSVSRGNTGALGANPSGSALALVQSLTIEFMSNQERAYTMMLEKIGTQLINVCKEFITVEKKIMITGKSNRSYQKEFIGSDIEDIDVVQVDIGNPLSRTLAGRVDTAETLLKNKLIQTPEQYIQVRNTGKLEPMTEGITSELMNVKAENEDLTEGKKPIVILTDDHVLHIKEHKIVLSSPESRVDQEIVNNTLMHIQEHIQALKTSDPALLSILNQPQIQAPPMPMGSGQQPQQQESKMPRMPTNPVSGKQYNPNTGGL